MLLQLLCLPIIASLTLFFIPSYRVSWINNVAFFWSNFIFLSSILFLSFFNLSSTQFQFCQSFSWIPFLSDSSIIGLDGIACVFIMLTAFLTVTCCALSYGFSAKGYDAKFYNISFFLLEFFLFLVFSSLDLLLFYLSFEAVLIPMYFIIGLYGSRNRRTRAAYLLFFYTLVSSVFLFLAILFLFVKFGTVNFQTLKTVSLDPFTEKLLWLAFFFSFSVKMPLFPFHIWLPEAHCEAPTAGSVILAGVLLKLGGFGFLRYSLGLFPESSAFFTPFVYSLCIFGSIYASLTTLQQVDLKKVIAYSSVGHMALVTLGIFSCNSQGILGSVTLMFGHGLVSSALFLCIGFLYERHNTRIIKYYSGLVYTMPIFSSFFFFFTLANIGLPGTCNFIGEFLILVSCFEINTSVSLICGVSMILTAGYSLWLFSRLFFGNLKRTASMNFFDITRLEFFLLLPFAFAILIFGLCPSFLTYYITIG